MNPARMGALGFLFGMRPVPASRCRMLELGCGQGFTLLALAQLFPQSEFIGVDLSQRQVENANRLAAHAGLTNVRFEHRSIMDISLERDGAFDYIASHGVYSWVPSDVREKLLEICGSQLGPQGMAYVSYNTLPGWAHLRVIREILMYHTQRYEDPLEKYAQAQALVGFLRESAPGGKDSWLAKWLDSVQRLLAQSEPAYFVHEYLEENNDPCFFHEFMERAAKYGLQYLSESHVGSVFPTNLGPQAAKVIEMLKRSVVEGEQYMDFARNTQFRCTLLCRQEVAVERALSPARLGQLLFSTALAPVVDQVDLTAGVAVEFAFANGSRFNSKDSLVKAALVYLKNNPGIFLSLPAMLNGARAVMREREFPEAVSDDAAGLGKLATLMDRFIRVGTVELSTPDLGGYLPVGALSQNPLAPPLARAQAELKMRVLRNNLSSSPVSEAMALILPHCDGTRTLDDLFAIYQENVRAGRLMPPVPKSPDEPPDFHSAFESLKKELTLGRLIWREPLSAS